MEMKILNFNNQHGCEFFTPKVSFGWNLWKFLYADDGLATYWPLGLTFFGYLPMGQPIYDFVKPKRCESWHALRILNWVMII